MHTQTRRRRAGGQRGPLTGLIGQLALLDGPRGDGGLTASGWLTGMLRGGHNHGADRGLAKDGRERLGPANRITLVRATLVGGVAALIARP